MKIDQKKCMQFGLLTALVLILIGAWNSSDSLNFWAAAVLAITLMAPRMLTPAAWLWFEAGELLGSVVTRIVLGALFFCIVTPVGLIRRIARREGRFRAFGRGGESLFVSREKIFTPSDFEDQF